MLKLQCVSCIKVLSLGFCSCGHCRTTQQMLQVHSITKKVQNKWSQSMPYEGLVTLRLSIDQIGLNSLPLSCKTADCTRLAKLAISANLPIIALHCPVCKYLHLDK